MPFIMPIERKDFMNEVLGEYGSLIVEIIVASVMLVLMEQLLMPSFTNWAGAFFDLIM